MSEEKETWFDIPGFGELYQITISGKVKKKPIKTCENSQKRKDRKKVLPERLLKSSLTLDYITYQIRENGRLKRIGVHRLLAITFIPNPQNLPVINHKNGVKSDNRLENLEWCSVSHNTAHAYAMGLSASGEKHLRSKITNADVAEIRRLYAEGSKQRDLAKQFGVVHGAISNIISGRTWKHFKVNAELKR